MTIDVTEKLTSSRRWKFSLRNLIVFVTLFCVCAAGFSHWLRWKQYQQKWTVMHARVDKDASSGEEVTSLEYFGGVDGFAAEIMQLPNLRMLYIANPSFTAIPLEIMKLSNLESLEFQQCPLNTIPPEIGSLDKLSELIICHSRVTELPSEIWQLTKLNGLSLQGNQLTEIPTEIGKLRNLVRLFINVNQITALPAEIGRLNKLETLYVGLNQLASLPKEIAKLKSLRDLHLAGNPIKDADLKLLTSLENLESVNLMNTQVTKEGVASLQLALPKCEIASNAN